jgi:hypothetical protein
MKSKSFRLSWWGMFVNPFDEREILKCSDSVMIMTLKMSMSNRRFFNFEGMRDFDELFDHPLIRIAVDNFNDYDSFTHNCRVNFRFSLWSSFSRFLDSIVRDWRLHKRNIPSLDDAIDPVSRLFSLKDSIPEIWVLKTTRTRLTRIWTIHAICRRLWGENRSNPFIHSVVYHHPKIAYRLAVWGTIQQFQKNMNFVK